MNKKYIILFSSIIVPVAAFSMVATYDNEASQKAFANSSDIWVHYAAVSPTENTHGSKEFWASCSTHNFSLVEPTGVSVQEGDPFNTTIYFNNVSYGDDRFVPSIKDSENGVYPILNDSSISYGLYPQERIKDNTLISTLNSLPSSAIASNGWYLYNNRYYTKVVANKSDVNYTFNDGTTITNGTTYWFKCQPIEWKILNSNNGTYSLISESLLEKFCFYHENKNRSNNTIYPNNYEYSDLRAWLNGYNGSSYNVDNYSGIGFINKAFLNPSFIQQTLVDNSASQTTASAAEYACSNTNDKIYCLSYYEYSTLLTKVERQKTAGDYSIAQGAKLKKMSTDNKYYGIYWTRSPYAYPGNTWAIDGDGDFSHFLLQHYITASFNVRPAMTIKL